MVFNGKMNQEDIAGAINMLKCEYGCDDCNASERCLYGDGRECKVRVAIDSLKRQLKMRYRGKLKELAECPVCGNDCTYDNVWVYDFCPYCGQAIDGGE